MTRNMKLPARSVMAGTIASPSTVSSEPTGAKLLAKSAPSSTPMNREEKTSFVISARMIATMGGTSAQNE